MNKKVRIFALCFLFVIFSISIVSAVGYDWKGYGSSSEYITQSANSTIFAELNNGYNFTLGGLANIGQPLITDLTNETQNYIVYQTYYGYLGIINSSLSILTASSMGGTPIRQHGIVDWDRDGNNEIASMVRYNLTELGFLIFKFDGTILSNIFTYNFSHPASNEISGLKCNQDECWTMLIDNSNGGFYSWYFLQFSPDFPSNYSALTILTHENTYPFEPLSRLDIDSDGIDDYLAVAFDKILIFNNASSGFIKFNITGMTYSTSRFYNFDGNYRIATITSNNQFLYIHNTSGGLMAYHQNPISTPVGMCVADYDEDGFDELMTLDWHYANSNTNYSVYDGDASLIYRQNQTIFGVQPAGLICGKMSGANTYDFIVSIFETYVGWGGLNIFSPERNESVFYYDRVGAGSIPPLYCSAGDINLDTSLEIFCSSQDTGGIASGSIFIYGTNISNFTANNNPTINSITFNPTTSINRGETIYAIINAVDNESDTIYYSARCSSTANYSAPSTNPTTSCYYANSGSFVMTLAVKDAYHSWYNTYFQTIIVFSQNMTQVEGGLALPMDLVNPDNINQGLLPEIYYGILAFASGSYLPLFIIIFGIFVVLIILALFGIVKRIAQKVFE